MIAVIDYGVGNVHALMNVFRRLNTKAVLAQTPQELASADRLLLPGVGAFDSVMKQFNASPLRSAVEELVLSKGVPVLGICVGMQILASTSEEGVERGLGWIPGDVRRFRGTDRALPHMGWNSVTAKRTNGLFAGLDAESRFYFLHSYHFECAEQGDVLATTDYDGEFVSAVRRGHIYGAQFHPEKSHRWGERLLKNFAEEDHC
jgi:glutamine amidotransferase